MTEENPLVSPPPELTAMVSSEWPRLVGALALYTGDGALAEDLAQETVERLARNWKKVRRLDKPAAWTYQVGFNLARSHFRRLRTARRARSRLATAETMNEPDPADAMAVREAVARLPDRERRVLLLRYWVGLPVAEVAAAIGCPEGTVKTLTRRAIARLRSDGLIDNEEEEAAHAE